MVNYAGIWVWSSQFSGFVLVPGWFGAKMLQVVWHMQYFAKERSGLRQTFLAALASLYLPWVTVLSD